MLEQFNNTDEHPQMQVKLHMSLVNMRIQLMWYKAKLLVDFFLQPICHSDGSVLILAESAHLYETAA